MTADAVEIRDLTHHYGERAALAGIDLSLARGEIFGLLGPNGGGKTTLFRILCTLLPLQQGTARVLGFDVGSSPVDVRRRIGITFQSPSLDGKLTVAENLRHQSHLYGLAGKVMRARIAELLQQFALADRRRDLVETLSGGLKRRVELAKGLLHRPELLLLDEPSAGLDPGARRDLWNHLLELRRDGITVLVTTHLMEEAERCDRIAILDRGRLVAIGKPDDLRGEIGGEGVTIHCRDPEGLAGRIATRLGRTPQRIGESLRLELGDDRVTAASLLTEFSTEVRSLEFGKPTLEDVFLAKTGRAFEEEEAA
jgi:ABC-2 type transport system ATP-binding protein